MTNVFATALQQQLGSDQFVGKVLNDSGEVFFCIKLRPDRPTLTAVARNNQGSAPCSLWEVPLTDDRMTRHMEDDVEIFGSLDSFTVYFCDAIFNNPNVDGLPLDEVFPENLALKLTFTVGAMQLEGKLRLVCLQRDLHEQVFHMMKCLYVDRSTQLTREEWSLKPKVAANMIVTKSGINALEPSATDAKEEEAQETGPVKAKKRKAGGVSLFAKKVR